MNIGDRNAYFAIATTATLSVMFLGLLWSFKRAWSRQKEGQRAASKQKKPRQDFAKFKQTPRPKGILNVGNSCYLGSVIQFLAAGGDDFLDYFKKCNGVVAEELALLLHELSEDTGASVLNPTAFISSFSGALGGFSLRQQDAHEFLLALLNVPTSKKHFGLKRMNEDAVSLFDLQSVPFAGLQVIQYICLSCAAKRRKQHISSITLNSFRCLSLPANERAGVAELLYQYLSVPERIDDYVTFQPNRERCGAGVITRKYPLRLPKILLLHFAFDALKSGSSMALEESIAGPGYRYSLQAVIVHHGPTVQGGHFICYRRAMVDGDQRRLWYECNDSTVNSVEFESIQGSPYLLLFRQEE